MKLDPKINKIVNGCILAFIVWAIIGVLTNAKQLSNVSVSLLPGGVEHQDKVVMLIGKNDQAADYQLKIRSKKEGWVDLGTFANTPIGDGLTFTPNESFPTRTIQEIRLLDNDKIESDVLDQGPLNKGEYQGQNYGFKAVSEVNPSPSNRHPAPRGRLRRSRRDRDGASRRFAPSGFGAQDIAEISDAASGGECTRCDSASRPDCIGFSQPLSASQF